MTQAPPLLPPEEIKQHLTALEGWNQPEGTDQIEKEFSFKDYYHTMAFVNAVAWIANRQDHHPDMEVGYNRCNVIYSTHSAGGITAKDMEAAARIEAL